MAAAGAALSLPYQLLLMTPPSPVIARDLQFATGTAALGRPAAAADAATPPPKHVSYSPDTTLPSEEDAFYSQEQGAAGDAGAGRPPRRARGLMYAKSGVLISC